jgi:hypothetical protein
LHLDFKPFLVHFLGVSHRNDMKTSTVIRFALAAIFATLAFAGLAAGVPASQVLFSVPWLLMLRKGALTQPIPRKHWFGVFVMVGTFVAVMLTLAMLPIFLHRPYVEYKPAQPSIGRSAAAAAMWILWMWMIYRRWQMEKTKVEA